MPGEMKSKGVTMMLGRFANIEITARTATTNPVTTNRKTIRPVLSKGIEANHLSTPVAMPPRFCEHSANRRDHKLLRSQKIFTSSQRTVSVFNNLEGIESQCNASEIESNSAKTQ